MYAAYNNDPIATTPAFAAGAGGAGAFCTWTSSSCFLDDPAKAVCPSPSITPVRFRHYSRDNSVFAGDDYLIRGVAGAVLWRMLREFQALGRTRFSSRELRAAGSELGLPEVGDNLSARLITLAQRLDLLAAPVRVQRLGGGRLQLIVSGTLSLESD